MEKNDKIIPMVRESKFDLNGVSNEQLITELRNRGFAVSGQLAGVKY